jgi:hypothetical protein
VQQLEEPLLHVIQALRGKGNLNFLFVLPRNISGLGVAFIGTLRAHNFGFCFFISALYAFDVGVFGAILLFGQRPASE